MHKDRSLQKQPLEMCFRREVIQKSIKINFENILDENKLQKTKSLLAFHFTKIASIEDASKKSDIKKQDSSHRRTDPVVASKNDKS